MPQQILGKWLVASLVTKLFVGMILLGLFAKGNETTFTSKCLQAILWPTPPPPFKTYHKPSQGFDTTRGPM